MGKDTKLADRSSNLSSEAGALLSQLFQDTGPARNAFLDTITSALLTGGVAPAGGQGGNTGNAGGAGAGGTQTPIDLSDPSTITLTRQDLFDAYRRTPDGPSKLSDVDRITRQFGNEPFTLAQLQAEGGFSGLSSRSLSIFNRAIGSITSGQFKPASVAAAQQAGLGSTLPPIIAAARDTSKAATNTTTQQTQDQLASANLLNTPFGQRILSDTTLAGNQATARVGPQLASDILFNLAPTTLGIAPQIGGGISQAASAGASAAAAGAQQGQSGLGFGVGNFLGASAGGLLSNPALFT